jgi:hypothetical protein
MHDFYGLKRSSIDARSELTIVLTTKKDKKEED